MREGSFLVWIFPLTFKLRAILSLKGDAIICAAVRSVCACVCFGLLRKEKREVHGAVR